MQTQFLRFALVGVLATLTTYAVLIVGVEGLHLDAVMASVAGYGLGVIVNYSLNYRFTFNSEQHHHVVLPKFLIVAGSGMIINASVMYAGIKWIGIHYVLAQLVAVMIVFTLSYAANRLWTFAD